VHTLAAGRAAGRGAGLAAGLGAGRTAGLGAGWKGECWCALAERTRQSSARCLGTCRGQEHLLGSMNRK